MPYRNFENFWVLLNRIAGENPDNPAILFDGREISYSELFDKANRLAYALFKMGVRRGDKISLWMQNTPEWVITWWAVPMIGAVIVPVDHWYKEIEAKHIIGHSDSKVVITYRSFGKWDFISILKKIKDDLPKLEKVVSVGESERIDGMEFDDLLEMGKGWKKDEDYLEYVKSVNPDDVCLILYTSGTTGTPKGVMLSQFQIIKNAYDQGENLRVTDKDKLVVPVPFSHCFGCVMSITLMACFGGAIAPLLVFNERTALETIERFGCTMIHGTPTMFNREIKLFREEKFDTSTLRTGIMAGAPCPEDLMRSVMNEMGANLCITYGLTEASPGITMTSLEDSIEDRVKTVGKPLPDIEVKIVDDKGREVPRGVVGEIVCRGYNVMKGYYKAPELTAKTVRDGWLYTGDLGVMDERGYVTFKGRKKELVIVGGYNVYPIEIESFIRQFEKVHEVAIVGVPDEDLGEVVACAVIPKDGVDLKPEEIVDFCYGKIASAKVPRYVYVTDSLPVSGRGKVQKFKLVEILKEKIERGELKKVVPTALKERQHFN